MCDDPLFQCFPTPLSFSIYFGPGYEISDFIMNKLHQACKFLVLVRPVSSPSNGMHPGGWEPLLYFIGSSLPLESYNMKKIRKLFFSSKI